MNPHKVLVIKTKLINDVVEFLTDMGLTFVEEKHGDGPVHYACEHNGVVLEIYPGQKDKVKFIP